MNNLKLYFQFILYMLFFNIIFTNVNAKNIQHFYDAESVSEYFSGIISLKDNKYENSYKYLKRLNGLENQHHKYSNAYLYSLVNLGRLDEAFKYSKQLHKKNIFTYESNLIIGLYFLKNKKYKLANEYFKRIKKDEYRNPLENILSEYLNQWVEISEIDFSAAEDLINKKKKKFKNIDKIQSTFFKCYFDSNKTEEYFKKLISDKENDFTRYNFFFANYLIKKNKNSEAIKILESSLKLSPRNLILNQLKIDLKQSKKNIFRDKFNCKNLSHVTAELFYIISNALSSRAMYFDSNFHLNLAKYLNPNFTSYNNLYAENFYMIKNFDKSKDIYSKIKLIGEVYNWHATKKISLISIKQGKIDGGLKYFKDNFNKIKNPNEYQIFDLAEVLKVNEKYKDSIIHYSQVLDMIDKNHYLYSQTTHGRGIAYERDGEWEKAEKDLLSSLSVKPNQAHVINYLAYTWVEQGVNIEKSMSMLHTANELKKNDGYIIDSLGWALFKLKKYNEAKKYLELAVILMPTDPVVNDHYGDSLWMNGKKIQARYYWNYALNLEETKDDLKIIIKKKMIMGLKFNL
jgi:tetratricopeptide (TPR) repeat protein